MTRTLPRVGILAYGPIQYHTPLYQLLAKRGNVDVDVLFLSDQGYQSAIDHGFGVPVAWDIDLLSGYEHDFLSTIENTVSLPRRATKLSRWIPAHDAIVVNGYTSLWMLYAMGICRSRGVPYLLRASSHPTGRAIGVRRSIRNMGARMIVSGSAAGLSMGHLNEQFYRKFGAKRIVFAPNSVDDERFSTPPLVGRAELLARWELDDSLPVIMYCGKLYPGKRPLDLVTAVDLLSQETTTIFVGDGSLAERIRTSLDPSRGVVTGFVNQSELPSYYHAADILVQPSAGETWGLVINEAMAAGALPVVSDKVGAAPDLVDGFGEVYPCGDVTRLAAALDRALVRVKDPEIRDQARVHVARYSLERTAVGFEEAAMAISSEDRAAARSSRSYVREGHNWSTRRKL
jgi:glycosyltransferase involved in cell wall biosynthesis